MKRRREPPPPPHKHTVSRRASACPLLGAQWSGTAARVRNAHNCHLHRGSGLGEGTAAGGALAAHLFQGCMHSRERPRNCS